jgi:hypothetical protein
MLVNPVFGLSCIVEGSRMRSLSLLLFELILVLCAVPVLLFFSFQISKRYNSLSIFLSLIFIIFWSLLGALPLLLGKVLNGSATPIFIIEKELFVIFPDLDYLYVLLTYILFISCLLYILWRVHPHLERRFKTLSKNSWIKFSDRFSHSMLLAFNGALAILLIINLNTLESTAGGMPLYLTENRVPSRIIDYSRTGVLLSTALGALLLVIGTTLNKGKKNIYSLLYLSVFLLACYPFWITGARNTLFMTMVGLIVGALSLNSISNHSYYQNFHQLKLIVALVLVSFICISVTSTTRGLETRSAPTNKVSVVGQAPTNKVSVVGQAPTNKVSVVGQALTNKVSVVGQALTKKSSYIDWVGRGEILDSHASLYGVITKMNSRPSVRFENTYGRYAKILEVSSSKGYTINPVAALWMNIGIFAPFVAGAYFSLAILFFWCVSRVSPRKLWPIIALPSIALSSVAIPVILSRSGPEGLWGLFINVVFLPAIFLFLPTVLALKKTKS